MGGMTSGDVVLARLEVLSTQLDEQAARIAALEAENARLVASQAHHDAAVGATAGSEAKLRRRAMLTGALSATAAAALLSVAKEPRTAEATSNTTVLGASTDAYGLLVSPGAAAAPVTPILGTTNHGVIGSNTSATVLPLGSGVAGARYGAGLAGVLGVNGSDGFGVFGGSQSGPGVFGGSDTGPGIYAHSNNSNGVYSTAPLIAVWGRTTNGIGAVGQATQPAGIGVLGQAVPQDGVGVFGACGSPGWAGFFEGSVWVASHLWAWAGVVSGALGGDGAARAVYSLDSTEPVIEDFGEGTLTGGRAEIQLDPELAAVVRDGQYQVFLTEYEDHNALFVSNRTARDFVVRAKGAASEGKFGYRLVAKRRDAQGKRLERITPPKRPDVSNLKVPELPTRPRRTIQPGESDDR